MMLLGASYLNWCIRCDDVDFVTLIDGVLGVEKS